MAHSSARARARRELTQIKDKVRLERRERDSRIERAAFVVQVALDRRTSAEADAGEGIAALLAEGLTWKEADRWCGGLGLSELKRLRSCAPRGASASSSSNATTGLITSAPNFSAPTLPGTEEES